MTITVRDFLQAGENTLALEVVGGEEHLDKPIPEEAINRPGLALAGFFQYFAHRRIQVMGLAEITYLKSLENSERSGRLRQMFEKHIPCAVITLNRHALPEIIELAEEYNISLLRTPLITSRFINVATIILEELVSPKMRVQGTMIDILGIGVLVEGKPGIGKSETALTLIMRGHSLVSDDITELRRASSGSIVASPVDITRYHMEIRGLGIIHVPSLFGVASMRKEAKLDVVVRLERPGPKIEEDRSGLTPRVRDVMGVEVPFVIIPVAPGRDMANVVEVAALNQKLKGLGHDAAKELDEKLVKSLTEDKR